MKAIFIFITICLLSVNVKSQTPGGIQGKKFWFLPDSSKFQISNSINFYPSLKVDHKVFLDKVRSEIKSNEVSAFVVMQPSFLQEGYQLIDIESDNHMLSIQSDKIKSTKNLKIKNHDSDKPYFISYIESFEKKDENDLITGSSDKNNSYPNKFEGEIAEIIFYPKVLSNLERRKIETYFSLKYGISLSSDADYINSKNDTIWKKDENKVFIHRLTGIGKDTKGNLNHKQSSNVDDELLTIALGDKIEQKNELNKIELSDFNYLLWSDNGNDLEFNQDEKTPDISLFNRIWRTKSIGNNILENKFTFSFNPQWTIDKQNEKEENADEAELKYWLVFSPENSNEISLNNLEFIRSVSIPKGNEQVNFSEINLEQESFLFTLVKAPELFSIVDTKQNNCQSDIYLKVIGGIEPIQIDFFDKKSNGRQPIKQITTREFSVLELDAGNYISKITDASGQSFEQNITINGNFQNNLIIENLILRDGESKVLNLEKINKNKISNVIWSKDNLEIAAGAKFTIKDSGNYNIEYLTEEGCKQNSSFSVSKLPIKEWSGIYPNPVKANDPFYINLDNTASSEVKIIIKDYTGRILKSTIIKEGSEIYTDSFFEQGSYLIIVETATEKYQYTLIVK